MSVPRSASRRPALLRLLAAAFATVCAGSTVAQDGPQHLPSIDLTAGMYVIHAEVAQTDQEREIGLMFRTALPPQNGMIFVFEQPGVQCFWMRNTLIPLAAAFIDDDGRIVNVAEMAPKTENSHCSDKPVRFVLEMNKGWFDKRGFKPGFRLGGAPFNPR
jgi:uncharacterized membrane protein (UPF0127 family)